MHACRFLAATSLLAAAGLLPTAASAQDAARGAALYRELPGQPALESCFACHGEAVNNRNAVLRGAAGANLISKTIAAVSRMGYLRQYLADADLADIAAYLATVVPAGPVESLPDPWPTSDEFGAQLVGTQSASRVILIRNLQPRADIAIGAVLSSDPLNFPVQHDCPVSLPPFGQCSATSWFRPQGEGMARARIAVVNTSGQLLREATLAGTGTNAPPPVLAWSASPPQGLDFGQLAVGRMALRELSLSNRSGQAVSMTALRITGPGASRFTLDAPCATSGRLDAYASCTVTIGFAPSGAGRAEGWIELVSDASNAPLVRIAAAGVAAVAVEPVTPPVAGGNSGGGALSAAWLGLLLAAVLALRKSR